MYSDLIAAFAQLNCPTFHFICFQIAWIGCSSDLLRFIGCKSVEFPEDLSIHTHLRKNHCEARLNKLFEGKSIDWATAEALAFGSLLHEGKYRILIWLIWFCQLFGY